MQQYIQNMLTKPTPVSEAFLVNPSKPEQVELKTELSKKFHTCYIFTPNNIPKQCVFETAILISIIHKKNIRQKHSQPNVEQRLKLPIQSNQTQIITKTKSSPQKFNSYLNRLANCINFFQTVPSFVEQYKEIIYQTVLVICKKVEQTGWFGRGPVQYSLDDVTRFGKEFGEEVHFMDFDKDKTVKQDFKTGNLDGIYILKFKDKYYFLSGPQPEQKVVSKSQIKLSVSPSSTSISNKKPIMKIIDSGTLPASRVEQIFLKKSYTQESISSSQGSVRLTDDRKTKSQILYQTPSKDNNQQKPLLQNTPLQDTSSIRMTKNTTKPIQTVQTSPSIIRASSIRDSQVIQVPQQLNSSRSIADDSILLITKVKCGKCNKTNSQIDCLYWNYIYYCHKCLIDVEVDTSDIPAARMNKFLRERNIVTGKYDIRCPECHGLASIPKYNPAMKNQCYICQLCQKTICVPHKGNIYDCFCYCPKCKTPTIHVQKIKTNMCQKCGARYCFKCKKKGYKFCTCICKQCLGQSSKQHECQPACHSCNNKPTRLRECKCGMPICYGCYYRALEGWKAGDFPCNLTEYV